MTPRKLADCEREFANLVQGFIGRLDPSVRRHGEFICRSRAGQWAQNMPGTTLSAGVGFAEFENACARSYWRGSYYRNRTTILVQKRARRHSRPLRVVTCPRCGQQFRQVRVDSRFCSNYCAHYRATRDKPGPTDG
jgi:hypothetical protein